jgi:5'(3')-deoxyribonucleotidase
VFLLWKVDPIITLPSGVDVSTFAKISTDIDYVEWEKRVYFPLIAPNKATFCGAEGILIDDEFGNPNPNPLYETMIDQGRAIFFGSRGGVTRGSGPDWIAIERQVLQVLEEV